MELITRATPGKSLVTNISVLNASWFKTDTIKLDKPGYALLGPKLEGPIQVFGSKCNPQFSCIELNSS